MTSFLHHHCFTHIIRNSRNFYISFPLAFYSIFNCHGIFYRNSPTTSNFLATLMILWLLLYSQLPWHISLSDLHCHGILYRDSPTTTIICTLISNLFSTAMAHSLVILLTSTVMAYSTAIQLYMIRCSLRYLNCHGT